MSLRIFVGFNGRTEDIRRLTYIHIYIHTQRYAVDAIIKLVLKGRKEQEESDTRLEGIEQFLLFIKLAS